MATDPGARQADAPRPDFELPTIREVRAARVRVEPPVRRNFRAAPGEPRDALELVVTTDRPIPTRALGPVLYVGDVAVPGSGALDATTYRFVALEPDALPPGAPMRLGWSGEAPEQESGLRFEGA